VETISHFFSFWLEQYESYSTLDLTLELVAVFFGLLSVLYSKKNNILVFPTGIISTVLFVYLLYKWKLLGDMLINAYYFIMSIYGWYLWKQKTNGNAKRPITYTSKAEWFKAGLIFVFSLIFVSIIYYYNNLFGSIVSYIDTITTAIFFSGMWLMAKKNIENWIFWIIGDLISVPLYYYKGFLFTSFQYFVFTIIAFYGYKAWKHQITDS
jgi:nicotinamide mononucleotide transporter